MVRCDAMAAGGEKCVAPKELRITLYSKLLRVPKGRKHLQCKGRQDRGPKGPSLGATAPRPPRPTLKVGLSVKITKTKKYIVGLRKVE